MESWLKGHWVLSGLAADGWDLCWYDHAMYSCPSLAGSSALLLLVECKMGHLWGLLHLACPRQCGSSALPRQAACLALSQSQGRLPIPLLSLVGKPLIPARSTLQGCHDQPLLPGAYLWIVPQHIPLFLPQLFHFNVCTESSPASDSSVE